MLSAADEWPIHQTSEPIAFAGTDRNFYDRYFFNGYTADASVFFACALGIYPHLDVIDAHFCVLRNGRQVNLHASAPLKGERMTLSCGPIAIAIVEPLQKLSIRVAGESGLNAELHFEGRHFPIEEPRFIHRIGTRAFMDYTRMTQNGSWSGWITLDDERIDLADGCMGTRDRSWGIRPVGARDPQANPDAPELQFFWQWTPLNLESGSVFFHLNADGKGEAWNTRAVFARDGAGRDDLVEGSGVLETSLVPNTRWPAKGELSLTFPGSDMERLELAIEPIVRFQMRGLGYTDPEWGHGLFHGSERVAQDVITLSETGGADPSNLHVQMLSRISGDASGLGVFEQLALGAYAPLGLKDAFQPAS